MQISKSKPKKISILCTFKGTEEQDCLLQFHPIKDDKLGYGDLFILICFI